MSTFVVVNTYTHSVTYVTNKLLLTLKEIINLSGLSPAKLANQWDVLELGIQTWLESRHLKEIVLEVYNPKTDKLVGRWDLAIHYGYTGDSSFWVNTEEIRYHIKKAGLWPSECEYRVVVTNEPGRPDVEGWSSTTLRSTDGFVKQSLGTTLDGGGLGANTSYWRKV